MKSPTEMDRITSKLVRQFPNGTAKDSNYNDLNQNKNCDDEDIQNAAVYLS